MGADPMTLALISLGATAAGTGLSMYKQIEAGQEQRKWYDYNASVASENARLQAEKVGREGERLKGRQRALYGKSGVAFEGTPEAVMLETGSDIAKDIAAIRYRGAQAASIYGEMGESAEEASYWGAGSTLLSGAGSAFKTYSGMPKKTNKWTYESDYTDMDRSKVRGKFY